MTEQLYKKVWIGSDSDFCDSVAHQNKDNWKYVPIKNDEEVKIEGNDGSVLYMTVKKGIKNLYVDDKLIKLFEE